MNKSSVLIVAAHPDDEVLGCGGTIARHVQKGDAVSVLILADGVGARSPQESKLKEILSERRQSAEKACEILGVTNLDLLGYPDNAMDTVPLLHIVKDIEKAIERHRPNIVYTHHSSDVNIDHRIAHDAILAACRPQQENPVRQIMFFETPSSTEWRTPQSTPIFSANWFVDVSDTLKIKIEALKAYSRELRDFPHPRSLEAIEHLARWRGATAGLKAAEAFELGRLIV